MSDEELPIGESLEDMLINAADGADLQQHFDESICCTECNREFTFFLRRHHCRKCMRSFCDEHSRRVDARNVEDEGLADSAGVFGNVRMCNDCWDVLLHKKRLSVPSAPLSTANPPAKTTEPVDDQPTLTSDVTQRLSSWMSTFAATGTTDESTVEESSDEIGGAR
jgi:hypothetical protein